MTTSDDDARIFSFHPHQPSAEERLQQIDQMLADIREKLVEAAERGHLIEVRWEAGVYQRPGEDGFWQFRPSGGMEVHIKIPPGAGTLMDPEATPVDQARATAMAREAAKKLEELK